MLFSVIPKNVGFAAESAVAIAESIAGTEYDLESDLQNAKSERVRLGPSKVSWKKQFREILDPIRNQFISSIGAWDKSDAFSGYNYLQDQQYSR
jgi:hypothetical protein